ncbi:hypothetical protein [Methylobacterium durans]|uniref:Uncharacterized protein n=1 Tax=Methylobacterium durans TaxID=2202825 RepID=A0A2U8WB24_9HYPH|nr:hypothetical protein [Methylobacterium durans]AWN43337.1 hypothetical protein DK389_26055 [Methylobacterium durans]
MRSGLADWAITKDATSGAELGLRVRYWTGDTIVGTLQDDGSVHFTADSGIQNGLNSEQGSNANRSGISFDFSINTGVNTVTDGGKGFTLEVNNRYGEHFVFDLKHLSSGTDISVNRNTQAPVLGDEDGSNPHLSQNSLNFGYGSLDGHADNKGGTIDITLPETNTDHTAVYASQHIQIDVVDPIVSALQHGLLAA